jgi:alanyl-tRNA synthetase
LAPENALKDFGTKNIVTIQRCVRTSDIEGVGDDSRLSFFEMLGNFSFAGYGREEAIEYAHKFITEEMKLEISSVTVFAGFDFIPQDEESIKIWKSLGVKNIKEENMQNVFWGPTGDSGPCGPTTEIYCKNAKGEEVEIWNIVFNEYFCNNSREKLDRGEAKLTELPVLGIDTGMGLERLATIVQQKESVYDTNLFNGEKTREERIVADHLRAAEALIADGVIPSNLGRGYVLRRLIRRAVRFSNGPLKTAEGEIKKEEEKFRRTLNLGMKEFKKGTDPFILFTTYGFPIELTEELAKENGTIVDREEFDRKMAEHQKLSQTAAAGMFKGGLVNQKEETIKLHTAHHLLLAGLQAVLGAEVKQRGSNITEERLRIDFTWDHKLSEEEKRKVENWVNDKIKEGLEVARKEMPLAEAEKLGAEMEFNAKYPEIVSVYFIQNLKGDVLSKEFCNGPHAENTSQLGIFKILKEEAVSAGIRRIKATLVQ